MIAYAFVILGGLALAQAVLLLIGTFENRRFAASRRRANRKAFVGRVAVIAPCKGTDAALEQNLGRLFEQDYPDYELIFVVESDQDPACPIIRRQIHRHRQTRARLVIAGRSTDCGQKIHNLLSAVAHVSDDVAALAFVDSDAQPRSDWLTCLVSRLDNDTVGAVTGYRWFVPLRDTLPNWFLYSINALVASLYGPGGYYLIWGGSWATRRAVFERLEIARHWRGRLLDDLLATRVLRGAGLRVEFEPRCMVASPLDTNWREMFEFIRRQYLLGRFYSRGWWHTALVATTLTWTALLGNLGVAAARLWSGGAAAGGHLVVSAALIGLFYARAWLRYRLTVESLPEHAQTLRRARRFDLLATPLVGVVHWVGLLSSVWGNTLSWRGIEYSLFADGRVRIIGRQPEATMPIGPHHTVPAPHFMGPRPSTNAKADVQAER